MATSTTENEIELLFELVKNETGDDLELQHGSPINGRAWRIWGPRMTDYFGLGDGFLGKTKREAGLTLRGLYAGLLQGKVLSERGQL